MAVLSAFLMKEDFEKTIIKLAKSYKISPLEWQDIAQELRIHLWLKEKSRLYHIKNYNNWAYILCRNKLKKLHRYYTQQKRDSRKVVSLDLLKQNGYEKEG